jgi:hypothetical protein
MPWWAVGVSASEEAVSSIKGEAYFCCLFKSDLDICKTVGKLQTKLAVKSLSFALIATLSYFT